MARVLRKRGDVEREQAMGTAPLQRTPEGHINNCAVANGAVESSCQVCGGRCPDRPVQEPPAPAGAPAEEHVATPPTPFMFASAHDDAEHPLNPRFERLVERSFVDDPEREYEVLEHDLEVGEKRGDRGTLQEQLDRAQSNQRRAFKLYRTAKQVVAEWEHENRPIFAGMRSKAHAELESQKASKMRAKAIAEADIEDMAAAMHPKQWPAMQARRAKLHALERNCENLYETWRERSRVLVAMAGLVR